MINGIYPLILLDYDFFPLLTTVKNDTFTYLCNNEDDILKVLNLYYGEFDELVRNIVIIPEREKITYQTAQNDFSDIEECWFDRTIHFMSIKPVSENPTSSMQHDSINFLQWGNE